MKGEIAEAVARYTERMEAAGACDFRPADGERAGEEMVRRACVGLDIDFDELLKVLEAESAPVALGIALGIPPVAAAQGQWVAGFAVGLILAEARQREEATR